MWTGTYIGQGILFAFISIDNSNSSIIKILGMPAYNAVLGAFESGGYMPSTSQPAV